MSATPVARPWQRLILLPALSALTAHTSHSGGTSALSGPAQEAASAVEPIRLERAHTRLARISGTFAGEVPLAELLTRMLSPEDRGELRSLPDEHRAALVAVAFYVNQWPIELLVREARTWPRATSRPVTLGGRRDHARHFIVSAAMAATAGSALADAIGLYKEVRDSQGASGFSFSDVTANRAGQRFGTLASGSPTSAARLADRLRGPLADDDIMPATTGLPDDLSDLEFARRYGTIGGAAFTGLVDEIDRRVSALDLYR